MAKLLLLVGSFLLATASIFAQLKGNNGSIKGVITTSDGKPAAFVTVRIDQTKWQTMTDEKGQYQLDNVRAGNYLLKVSAVAKTSQEQSITVATGQTLQVDFVLTENAAELQEVVVTMRNRNKENRGVAKMPLRNLENPQVYSTVSSEIMKQQAIVNYDDAFRNVPGIVKNWDATGRNGDGASYFALRGFDAQPLLYNGLPGIVAGNLDPADVEEIEVLKGPSGTLFGGAFYSYGGMINTITKKPYFDTGGEIAYNFGSFGLNRITADFNTPLSKKEKVALRVNAAYHSENSWQDAGFKKSFFIAPALVYEVNDRLTFHLLTEFLSEERAVAPVFFQSDRFTPLPFKSVEELALNRKLSFISNDITIKNPRFNLQAQMLYKLSPVWSSQTVISRGSVKGDGYYSYIWDDVGGDSLFSHTFHKENHETVTTDIQQNFNADFKIGTMRNRLLIGLDYFSRNVVDNGSADWLFARSVTPQGRVDFKNPSTGEERLVYMTKASIDQLFANSDANNSNISNRTFSAYVSDVINFTPRLSAMASLRADYFDSDGDKFTDADDETGEYDQFALSPKFGLVYQPILDKVSLFANYMNAFINVAPRLAQGGPQSFKPEQANQWEGGVKVNLFSGKLFSTISVYDIRVSDRVVGVAGSPNVYTQGGKVKSSGLEVEVTANPVDGLSLIAGYAYNKTEVLKGNKEDFYSEPGRTIGGQGPSNLANLWATYKFSQGALKNFGIAAGGNYASEYKVIDNAATGVFILPSYTLLNASIFYNIAQIRVTLNVNNITDKEYYTGYWSINPQRPRNFVMSVAYKF